MFPLEFFPFQAVASAEALAQETPPEGTPEVPLTLVVQQQQQQQETEDATVTLARQAMAHYNAVRFFYPCLWRLLFLLKPLASSPAALEELALTLIGEMRYAQIVLTSLMGMEAPSAVYRFQPPYLPTPPEVVAALRALHADTLTRVGRSCSPEETARLAEATLLFARTLQQGKSPQLAYNLYLSKFPAVVR